ncbi:MAG: DUF6569 family protein [Phycisphaerae bacterium]
MPRTHAQTHAPTQRLGSLVAGAVAVVLTIALIVAVVAALAGAAHAKHVPEVQRLLGGLTIEPPRTHKHMLVYPIRWSGTQAPGAWETLDAALAAGHLKVGEMARAAVPTVEVTNTGGRSVFLMSGEIIQGGKQTRVIRKDTVVEPQQKVAVAVFCVERGRWAGGKAFKRAANVAPASIQDAINRGEGQGEVWQRVREAAPSLGGESASESLDAMLESEKARRSFDEAHKDLGKFSPPDTVGIAVADARTGKVVGLELFGRRDLFDGLQEKLVEGYIADIVLAASSAAPADAKDVPTAAVLAFVHRALKGTSAYEDTPGSGRGLTLESGSICGKGVAVGGDAIHLSVQDTHPKAAPARPIVDDPRPQPARPPIERLR